MQRQRNGSGHTLFAAMGLVAAGLVMDSALAGDTYKQPPDVVVRALQAPPPPSVDLSPDGATMLLMERRQLPPIAELAQPMHRLAGLRISPANNAVHQSRWSFSALTLRSVEGGDERSVETPDGARITSVNWSPDGSMVAFIATTQDESSLFVADVRTGQSKNLTNGRTNAILGGSYSWLPDNRSIVARIVPDGRGGPPPAPRVPSGPIIQETSGITAPVRTYQDLLEDEHDEALFDYYLTTQLAIVDIASGSVTNVGEPAVYVDSEPSPDGTSLLVSRLERPYSYLVTYRSFPEEVEVWNLDSGKTTHIASLPLRDQTPIGGVPTGPRGHGWQNNADATLLWAEALDGGNPDFETDTRDKVVRLTAPFTGAPEEMLVLEDRYRGTTWINDGQLAFVSEYDRDERWSRQWLFDFETPSAGKKLVHERNVQDRYADPGRPIMTMNAGGKSVAHVHEDSVFLTGSGSTPDGDRPFIDRMTLANDSFETERLWRNSGESYESVRELLADDGSVVMTSYETPTTPANFFAVNVEDEGRTQLTHFEDPAPELQGITKRLVKYDRSDGVSLSATLYLPADYREGQKLPLMVWAYPLEYNDARTGGQVRGSQYRFTRISGSSHLFLLTQGYAIMDNATMPVIGDPETVNDDFREQIIASADAAIQFAAGEGVADPNRVGVGGHSYGAFMTANLLAHCDLFKAGIARSGAYNRTLTPFGFQSERRTLWESPETYFAISPFMHANKINEPMLMIHGQVDNNSGTFPIQSERMFHAIKGHGGTTRLVMLPNESHGYRAEESVMHTVAEMIEWMDTHVKYASTEEMGSAE